MLQTFTTVYVYIWIKEKCLMNDRYSCLLLDIYSGSDSVARVSSKQTCYELVVYEI